ncbi:unnamed protein product [Schistocephalus solidus]|uniref:L-2-hydroxyglutarate dehydrogenase, mitochondrial n=1 Tax=Schistocephalus solidus TaxID=70667 RepID=A0A0X3NRA4_SCHSO|nr:unnamed protein product [Schistocephalus solidus]
MLKPCLDTLSTSINPTLSLHRCVSNSSFTNGFDLAVVGGGIIGLAVAKHICVRYPKLKLCLLEKEQEVSLHQSYRNSGVIHTGIYYKPGSLKARLCLEGLNKTYEYCERKKIPYMRPGKLIVAVEEKELPALDKLYSRALENKVPGVTLVPGKDIQSIEPACRGLKAIYSPNTGIVDYRAIALSLADDFIGNKGKLLLGFEVCEILEDGGSARYPIRIVNKKVRNQHINCKYLVTCAGLQSDRIAAISGCAKDPKIIPFRGEYLRLTPEKSSLVSTNIYPVPDPRFPFLGVHFTPRINGEVWLGPSATLSFKREGYSGLNFSLKDTLDFIAYPGLLRLASQYLTFGLREYCRSIFISQQVKHLQRYVPSLRTVDVERARAGIRAQALDLHGKLVDDFSFDSGTGAIGALILHVRNAPSPGATSSMAIARIVSENAAQQFGLSI